MKRLILLLALMLWALAAPAEELETTRLRTPAYQGQNWIITQAAKKRITIIGLISSGTSKSFRESLEEFPMINEIVVDSQGGDIESAINIARMVKQRKMRLIVDGRCLSSCAFFLFTAAEKKNVLKNSIVAVHEITHFYIENNLIKSVSGMEINELISKNNNVNTLSGVRHLNSLLLDFYRDFDIKPKHYENYIEYVSNRKKYLGVDEINFVAGDESCPRFLGWMLSKDQLENTGVTGIESFWFPQNEQEILETYQVNQLAKNTLFQGDGTRLKNYCKGKPVNWIKRKINWLIVLTNTNFKNICANEYINKIFCSTKIE